MSAAAPSRPRKTTAAPGIRTTTSARVRSRSNTPVSTPRTRQIRIDADLAQRLYETLNARTPRARRQASHYSPPRDTHLKGDMLMMNMMMMILQEKKKM